MDRFIEKYHELRAQLDSEISKFERMHTSELKCKKGCDSCCESISIFPLEFYAIQKELANAKLPARKIKHSFSKACRFLSNGECVIYNSRPFICRTQGLPLLYENIEGSGFELSVCQLNFKGVNVNKFNKENALYMPPINSKLFLLNKEFIQSLPNKKLKPTFRIKTNKL